MPITVQIADALFATGDGVFLGGVVDLVQGAKKRSHTASIILADPLWELANTLPLPTRQARIPFKVWYREHHRAKAERLFTGWVGSMSAADVPGRLSIMGVDRSKAARRKQRARVLESTSIHQLAQQVASEEGLTLDTSKADRAQLRRVGSVWQHGEGDWQVLERLALAIGHEVVAEDDTLVVQRLDATRGEANGEVEIRRGSRNIEGGLAIQISERVPRQSRTVDDYKGQRVVKTSPDEAVFRPVQQSRTGLAFEADELPSYTDQAVEWARRGQSRKNKVFEAKVLMTDLYPKVKPRSAATVIGYGQRFDGVWVVERVHHDLAREQTGLEIYNGGSDV